MCVLDDVVAKDLGLAAVETEQRGEHADGGGLAGTIGAKHAVDDARRDIEIDVIDSALVAKVLDEAVCLDCPF